MNARSIVKVLPASEPFEAKRATPSLTVTSLLSPEETIAAINAMNKKKPTIEANKTPSIAAKTDFKNDFIGQLNFCKYNC